MKRSAVVILMLNSLCALSQIAHEILISVGCFHNGTAQLKADFDAEELAYVDFERGELVYTVPTFEISDPSSIFEAIATYKSAKKGKNTCSAVLAYMMDLEKNLPEEKDPPEIVLYPADEVELGVENRLICFVDHFYPPYIEVSWTKNGQPVSQEVPLSRYYPNNDKTFYQFSTLTFTPSEGDIYSCTVEHVTLERPKTIIWENKFNHHDYGADVYCGVGLTLGLLGVTAGTFLIAKGIYGRTFPY